MVRFLIRILGLILYDTISVLSSIIYNLIVTYVYYIKCKVMILIMINNYIKYFYGFIYYYNIT